MPSNKNAWIRYRALDACFRNTRRKYYIEDLEEVVNQTLEDYDGSSVSTRQIRQDIADMQRDALGAAPIVAKRDGGHSVYYTYEDKSFSIMNLPLTQQEADQLNDTIQMLSRFKGMPRFTWMNELLAKLKIGFQLDGSVAGTVAFQQNPYLKGLDWFEPLWDAIVKKRVVELSYRRRSDRPAKSKIVHPYQLRQYNNRWYLIGYEEAQKTERPYTVRALDRIENVRVRKDIKYKPSDADFDEYFEDIVGVSLDGNGKVEHIEVKVEYPDALYLESKPIHGSQKIAEEGSGFKVFSWDLIPNEEFYQQLMNYAPRAEIVAPEAVKQEISRRAQVILDKNSRFQKG